VWGFVFVLSEVEKRVGEKMVDFFVTGIFALGSSLYHSLVLVYFYSAFIEA
jgi:hypothetical protein